MGDGRASGLGETTAGGASGGAHSYEAQSPRPWPISAHDHKRRYCRTQLLAPPKQQAWPGLLPPPARHSGIACCTHAARQITLRPSALQVSRTHSRSQHSTALLPPSADGGMVGEVMLASRSPREPWECAPGHKFTARVDPSPSHTPSVPPSRPTRGHQETCAANRRAWGRRPVPGT